MKIMAKKNRNVDRDGQKDMTSSKLYIIAEWIWRLFVLNTLTLVTFLGIITIMPALVACFRTIKICYEEDETHYIKTYYKNFVYCFKDTVFLGVFVFIVLGMLGYAYYYYSVVIDTLVEDGTFKGWLNLYSILLGFDIVFFLVLFLVIIQFPMVVTYFHFRFFDKIRFAFYMAYKHVGMSLLIFLVNVVNVVIVVLLPYYFFFFFFSIPILVTFMLSRRVYWFTASNVTYGEDEADEYDRTGKKVNRETYEDSDEEKIDIDKAKELEEINREIMNGENNGKTRN